MTEWIQQLIDSNQIPAVTAFLLGLVTAVSPCPLATNITAVGYIGRDVGTRNNVFRYGLLYALGRTAAYVAIGAVTIPILRAGASTYFIQKFLAEYGLVITAAALIIVGLFMLFGHKLKLPRFGVGTSGDKLGRRGGLGAFLLGVLFAMAFCPSSGVLFFGVLIPLSAAESLGIWLTVVYAVATALPIVIVAWILAYSVNGIGRFYNGMQKVQKYMNLGISFIFIAVGLYLTAIYFRP